MKLRSLHDGLAQIWCPACNGGHTVRISGNGAWEFNGDFDRPTLTPSVLVTWNGEPPMRCHSFVRDGRIEFLSDCTHALAGQTVDLLEVPT
jgi:hypothetical protein